MNIVKSSRREGGRKTGYIVAMGAERGEGEQI